MGGLSNAGFSPQNLPDLTCNRNINGQDERACLYYHIGRCAVLCIGAVNREQYRAMIDSLCTFSAGQIEPVVTNLQRQMGGGFGGDEL